MSRYLWNFDIELWLSLHQNSILNIKIFKKIGMFYFSIRRIGQISRVYYFFSICRQPDLPENPATRDVLGINFIMCPITYEFCCNTISDFSNLSWQHMKVLILMVINLFLLSILCNVRELANQVKQIACKSYDEAFTILLE